MQVARTEVLELILRLYGEEHMRVASERLPDPVDTERDVTLLVRLGLTHDQIYSQLGASP